MNKEDILYQLDRIDKLASMEINTLYSYKEICKDIQGYVENIRKEIAK